MGGWGRGEAAAPKPFLTTNEFSDMTPLQKGFFIAETAEYAEQYLRKSLRSPRSLR
jgi:hypothetical protein